MKFIDTRFGFANMKVLCVQKAHRFETVIVDV